MEGGLDPEYVLDKMQQYEIPVLLSNINKRYRESWEQTRFISYIIAQSNSSKKLKLTDIMSFPWDKSSERKVKRVSEVDNSEEHRARLDEEAKKFEKLLNKD